MYLEIEINRDSIFVNEFSMIEGMNGQIYNFVFYEIRQISLLKCDERETLVTLLEPVIIFHK
jgi:hypothetical protein